MKTENIYSVAKNRAWLKSEKNW